MSEAPERIFARFATTGPGINIRKWSTSEFSEAEAIYLRADTAIPKAEAEAMVAAAYEDVLGHLRPIKGKSSEYPAHFIRWLLTRRPADARAALDKITKEAEQRGWARGMESRVHIAAGEIVREAVEAERERCAGIVAEYAPNSSFMEEALDLICETKETGE